MYGNILKQMAKNKLGERELYIYNKKNLASLETCLKAHANHTFTYIYTLICAHGHNIHKQIQTL